MSLLRLEYVLKLAGKRPTATDEAMVDYNVKEKKGTAPCASVYCLTPPLYGSCPQLPNLPKNDAFTAHVSCAEPTASLHLEISRFAVSFVIVLVVEVAFWHTSESTLTTV